MQTCVCKCFVVVVAVTDEVWCCFCFCLHRQVADFKKGIAALTKVYESLSDKYKTCLESIRASIDNAQYVLLHGYVTAGF